MTDAARQRLQALARDWLPGPAADASPSERIGMGPWSGPAVRAFLVIVVLAAGVAGYLMWHAQPREAVPVSTLSPPPTAIALPEPGPSLVPSSASASPMPAADIVVHVAGLVARPGIVRLPPGARVADAVAAAGGVTRRRAADSVNLARPVVDGEQILVTDPGRAPASSTSAAMPLGPTGSTGSPELPGVPMVVDLNAASEQVLDSLPGVGPVLASRILAWRQEHGAFRSVDELGEVSGIGEAILERLRPLVRI